MGRYADTLDVASIGSHTGMSAIVSQPLLIRQTVSVSGRSQTSRTPPYRTCTGREHVPMRSSPMSVSGGRECSTTDPTFAAAMTTLAACGAKCLFCHRAKSGCEQNLSAHCSTCCQCSYYGAARQTPAWRFRRQCMTLTGVCMLTQEARVEHPHGTDRHDRSRGRPARRRCRAGESTDGCVHM